MPRKDDSDSEDEHGERPSKSSLESPANGHAPASAKYGAGSTYFYKPDVLTLSEVHTKKLKVFPHDAAFFSGAARQIVKDNYLADGGEPQGSKGQADDPRMFDAGPKDLFTKPKHDDFNPVDFGSKDCYLRKGRVVLLPMHLFNKPWRDGMSDSSAPRPILLMCHVPKERKVKSEGAPPKRDPSRLLFIMQSNQEGHGVKEYRFGDEEFLGLVSREPLESYQKKSPRIGPAKTQELYTARGVIGRQWCRFRKEFVQLFVSAMSEFPSPVELTGIPISIVQKEDKVLSDTHYGLVHDFARWNSVLGNITGASVLLIPKPK